MNVESRIAELEAKTTLTNAEMNELMSLQPSGTFKSLPNLLTLGVKNIEVFARNLAVGSEKVKEALEKEFYIEVISLRMQSIEMFLRMFLVAKTGSTTSIDPDKDKRTFGVFIAECEKLGFDAGLISDLKDFNNHRINAIHKFLTGEIAYSDLKDVSLNTADLGKRTAEYVGNAVGVPIFN